MKAVCGLYNIPERKENAYMVYGVCNQQQQQQQHGKEKQMPGLKYTPTFAFLKHTFEGRFEPIPEFLHDPIVDFDGKSYLIITVPPLSESQRKAGPCLPTVTIVRTADDNRGDGCNVATTTPTIDDDRMPGSSTDHLAGKSAPVKSVGVDDHTIMKKQERIVIEQGRIYYVANGRTRIADTTTQHAITAWFINAAKEVNAHAHLLKEQERVASPMQHVNGSSSSLSPSPSPSPSSPSLSPHALPPSPSSWDYFLAHKLHGFEFSTRRYVLVADALKTAVTPETIAHLGRIPWTAVIDFDPESKISGLFKNCISADYR